MAARKPKKQQKKKSNPVAVALTVLLLGGLSYAGVYFKDSIFVTETPKVQKTAKPWYKDHAKAPEMIRLPDAPLILAAEEAEIDTTIEELKPRKPLKIKPKTSPTPRVASVDLSAKPSPPPAIYEEALPQDVYTPKPAPVPVTAPATIEEKSAPSTVQPRWMKYALKVTPPAGKPMIAIVIDDLGLDRRRTKQTLELAGPMTMAFIPYAKSLAKQATMAKAQGHELLLHLPMEPLNDKIDAGPNHLHTHLAEEDLKDRIHWNLERFEGYVGVNNHMGSKATTDESVMKALMAELRTREMLFLDSRTNPKSVGAKIAGLEGVPFAERNVFLDNVNEKGAVLKQLSLLEKVSKRSGFAVGIGHPRDGTIAALKEWLPAVIDKGFVLVPISQIVMKNQGLT